jgi:hypothetical protein
MARLTLQRPRIFSRFLLAGAMLVWMLCPATQAEGPLYPNPLDRFGAGVHQAFGPITNFDVGSLHLGWYLDWDVQYSPARPGGVEYAQLVWISEGRSMVPPGDLWVIARANPGALWIIGNEPECISQGNSTPEQYAEVYQELHTLIKSQDPSAQVAIGGVVQPTGLRLKWLDKVLDHYLATFGHPMPVDVWNMHNMILPEVRDQWGCGIPRGLDDAEGRLYAVEDNDSLDYFVQHVLDFRRWMRDHGQRNKPLIISEYGVLMPAEHAFTADRVNRYMNATFDYLLAARDDELGYPADENRLVQRWLWYSLNDRPWDPESGEGYNGALFDHRHLQYPGVLTAHGENWRRYTAALAVSSLEGRVALPHLSQAVADRRLLVELTVTVCGRAYRVTTDAQGNFALTGLAPGSCDITVRAGHTLRSVQRGYALQPGTNVLDVGQLVPGDVTSDNCVNLSDLWALAVGWTRRGDSRVDLNGDGISDVGDIALVFGNLGRCGDVVLDMPAH